MKYQKLPILQIISLICCLTMAGFARSTTKMMAQSFSSNSLGFQSDILGGKKEMATCQHNNVQYLVVISEKPVLVSVFKKPINTRHQWQLTQVITGSKSMPEVAQTPGIMTTSLPYMTSPNRILVSSDCQRMLIGNTNLNGEQSILIFLDMFTTEASGYSPYWEPVFRLADQSIPDFALSGSVPVEKVSYLQGIASISDLSETWSYCYSVSAPPITSSWLNSIVMIPAVPL